MVNLEKGCGSQLRSQKWVSLWYFDCLGYSAHLPPSLGFAFFANDFLNLMVPEGLILFGKTLPATIGSTRLMSELEATDAGI